MALKFIDDEKLTEFTKVVIEKAQAAADDAEARLHVNVVDPFSALFDSMRQKISLSSWIEQEKARQSQKTLQNALGDFHQHVLGSVEGWEDLGIGGSLDVRSMKNKVVAEIKNKHNTLNSGGLVQVYDKMQRHLDYGEIYKGFTAYLVNIVSKSPRSLDKPFQPSERRVRRKERENIRIVDGKTFYYMVTGEKDALEQLYKHLPTIIASINSSDPELVRRSPLFKELFHRAYLEK